jgi:hypothetical protein
MEKRELQNTASISIWAASLFALILTAFCLQGCFLAAVPIVAGAETAGEDVAPTGAWDLFKSMMGGPSPMEIQSTQLGIRTRQQQLDAYAAEKERRESERDATIGVLQDLWSWQHDPAIGDLLIYVKAGGDPRIAMQAAIQRTHWDYKPAASHQVEPEEKPVAQSSVTLKPSGSD